MWLSLHNLLLTAAVAVSVLHCTATTSAPEPKKPTLPDSATPKIQANSTPVPESTDPVESMVAEPASMALTGIPEGFSNETYFEVSVAGDSRFGYVWKVQPGEGVSCAIATGYSKFIPVAKLIELDISALPDGPITLCVIPANASKKPIPSKAIQKKWKKDTVVPVIELTSDDFNVNSPAQLEAAVSDDHGVAKTTWRRLEGAGELTFSSANQAMTSVAASLDGAYLIEVEVEDLAGNTATAEVSLTWDTLPPAVSAGVDQTTHLDLNLTGTVTGAATTQWTVVSGPVGSSIANSSSISTSVSAVTDGTYTLRLTATDLAGNTAFEEMVWELDTVPPVFGSLTYQSSILADGYLNMTERITSVALVQSFTATGYTAVSYGLVSGGGPCDASATFSATAPLANAPLITADGTWAVCMRLADLAGNLAYGSGAGFTVDTLAPTATLSGTPANYSHDLVLNVDIAGANVVNYSYKIGLSSSTDCSVSTGYSAPRSASTNVTDDISAYMDQSIRLCVRGIDLAGNIQSAGTSYTWNNSQTPAPPSNVNSSAKVARIDMTWDGDSFAANHMIVRRVGGAVSWSPTNGQTYAVGYTPDAGTHSVVYVGSRKTFADIRLSGVQQRNYKVFSVSATNRWSTGVATSDTPAVATAFTQTLQVSGTVNALAAAADGSGTLYVGGAFVSYKTSSSPGIIRLNQDLTVSTAFAVGAGFTGGAVQAVLPLPDGDVLVGGAFTAYKGTARNRIARLNSDGSLDTGFAVGTGFNNTVNSLAYDSATGAVYAGGVFTSFNGTTINRIARLTSAGALDTTFVVGTGFNNTIFALGYDEANDTLLCGGQFTTYNGVTRNRVIRLLASGAEDATFAVGTGFNNTVYAISLDSASGDAYIGGQFTTYNGTTKNRIIRLNSDGTNDAGFALGTAANNIVRALSLTTSGKIYAAGDFTTYAGASANRVVRINSSGTRDATFAVGTGPNTSVYAVMGDTNPWIGGIFTAIGTSKVAYFAELTSTGGVDPSNQIGSGLNGAVNAAVEDTVNGGTFVTGTFTSVYGTGLNRLAKIKTDGTIDTTFAIGAALNNTGSALALDPVSGALYVGGSFTTFAGVTVNRIVKILPNGTRDATFNVGTGFNNTVSALAFDPDLNALYVGGSFTTYKGVTANRFLRLAANGSVDAAFATGTSLDNAVTTIAITSTGNVLVGGSFTTYKGVAASRIIRILGTNGTADSSFVTGTGFNNTVNVLAEDPISGAVYVGGNFTSYNGTTQNRVTRLTAAGARDTAFAIGAGANNQIYSISVDVNANAVLMGGIFTTYAGAGSDRMVRILATGSKDTGYSVTTGANNTVRAVVLDSMGRNYLGGDFETWKQTATGSFVSVTGAAAMQ